MSWQACTWAADIQKVTQTATEQLVLIMLANFAGEDGRNAFPSIARIARNSRLSERAVQKTLRRLEEMGLIRQGNQRIAEAHIDRPDKRPTVYDLNLSLIEIPTISTEGGVNVVHPVSERGEPDDKSGVNLTTERGERGAPDPSLNHQDNPSARAGARELADGSPAPGAEEGAPYPRGEASTAGRAAGAQAALEGGGGEPARPDREGGQTETPREGGQRGKPMTDAARRRFHHQAFILDWLQGRRPMGFTFRALGIEERLADDAAIERLALAMPATYLRGVQGFVDWAEACLAGDLAAKIPIASVEALMRELADPVRRALMARRLALLKAAVERMKDDPAEDNPDTDDEERAA